MPTAQPVIRDKEFAKRLEVAVENHHLAPSGHGRQKWLRDRIHENFSVTLSPEAVTDMGAFLLRCRCTEDRSLHPSCPTHCWLLNSRRAVSIEIIPIITGLESQPLGEYPCSD